MGFAWSETRAKRLWCVGMMTYVHVESGGRPRGWGVIVNKLRPLGDMLSHTCCQYGII